MEVPEEAIGGCFRRETAVPDIREAITVGVGAARVGRPRKIRAHAVGRGESGPFANQDQTATDPKTEANRIADANSSLLNQCEWSDGPGIG